MLNMWIVLMVAGHIQAVNVPPPYIKTPAACQSLARLMSIDLAAEMGDTSDDPNVKVECIVSDSKPELAPDDGPGPNDPSIDPEEE